MFRRFSPRPARSRANGGNLGIRSGDRAARLAEQFPKENENISAALVPMRDDVPRQSRMLTIALSGAALCVLLIVCANLANLLITRALGRRKELAVRAAIGAGRDRLVRQLATETALLAIAGGVFGVLLAYVSVPALAQLAPVSLPTAAQPEVNLRVLMFAAILTLGLTYSRWKRFDLACRLGWYDLGDAPDGLGGQLGAAFRLF